MQADAEHSPGTVLKGEALHFVGGAAVGLGLLFYERLPMLIILAVIGGLQAFGLFYIISGGWVREAAQVTGTYLFTAGFKENKMGYATAIGLVLFVVIMALTVVMNRLLRRETVEF